MPTAVSPSASSRRVTGTIGWSRAANASRDGEVSPSRTGDLQRAVEARALAGVAGRSLLVDQDQQRVAVAVQPDVADPLAGGGGAPPPPPLPPAAPPGGPPGGGPPPGGVPRRTTPGRGGPLTAPGRPPAPRRRRGRRTAAAPTRSRTRPAGAPSSSRRVPAAARTRRPAPSGRG